MRENSALGLAHPEWVDGKRLWTDPGIRSIVDKLHNGDPALGWEGDPRLALYFEPEPGSDEGRWVLYRMEHDNVMRPIMRSRPGMELDERMILHLMAHDTRRGFDPASVVGSPLD